MLRCPLICQGTKVIDEIQGHLLSKMRVYFNHLIGGQGEGGGFLNQAWAISFKG